MVWNSMFKYSRVCFDRVRLVECVRPIGALPLDWAAPYEASAIQWESSSSAEKLEKAVWQILLQILRYLGADDPCIRGGMYIVHNSKERQSSSAEKLEKAVCQILLQILVQILRYQNLTAGCWWWSMYKREMKLLWGKLEKAVWILKYQKLMVRTLEKKKNILIKTYSYQKQ